MATYYLLLGLTLQRVKSNIIRAESFVHTILVVASLFPKGQLEIRIDMKAGFFLEDPLSLLDWFSHCAFPPYPSPFPQMLSLDSRRILSGDFSRDNDNGCWGTSGLSPFALIDSPGILSWFLG